MCTSIPEMGHAHSWSWFHLIALQCFKNNPTHTKGSINISMWYAGFGARDAVCVWLSQHPVWMLFWNNFIPNGAFFSLSLSLSLSLALSLCYSRTHATPFVLLLSDSLLLSLIINEWDQGSAVHSSKNVQKVLPVALCRASLTHSLYISSAPLTCLPNTSIYIHKCTPNK